MPNSDILSDDSKWMAYAIELARKGIYSTPPNPAVGCVIVRDNQLIAEGWHEKAGQPHAERVALAQAANKGMSVEGATVYVTLEPCSHHGKTPPCADALVESKVGKVVIASEDPNPLVAGKGILRLQNAGIEVDVGLLSTEAEALNTGFLHAMNHNLPYVRLKIANSVDGRTAMANGDSHWITGAESREQVHYMRARHGALITGIGTVLADDPSLNVRLTDEQLAEVGLTQENCHPIRVILDANLSMPLTAKMLKLPGKTILMTSKATVEDNIDLIEGFYAHGAEVVAVEAEGDKLDIQSVLEYLYQEEKVSDVMVEAGSIVAGAFIQYGLVNEIHVYMAPTLMGDTAKPMFTLPGLVEIEDKIAMQYDLIEQVGDDLHFVLKPKV